MTDRAVLRQIGSRGSASRAQKDKEREQRETGIYRIRSLSLFCGLISVKLLCGFFVNESGAVFPGSGYAKISNILGSLRQSRSAERAWEHLWDAFREVSMLRIHYGDLDSDQYIFNPDAFFNNTYEDSWITEPLSVKMIKDVDKSDVIGPRVIDSPFLGSIPTERLSGGVKTLILMAHDREHIFNASACGDNCARWILYIAQHVAQDEPLLIRLGYLMDFGREPFDIEVENTGTVVHSQRDLVLHVLDHHLI